MTESERTEWGMEHEKLVQEACEVHMEYARVLYKFIENFLSRGESRILIWLKDHESACAVDIIDHFGLSAGRVANILKSLENKGYLLRIKDDKDQRRSSIVLTDSGKEHAEMICQDLYHAFDGFFRVIGDEEAQMFLTFEKRIMEMVDRGVLDPDVPRKR